MYKVILKFKAINGLLQAWWTDHQRLSNYNLYFTEKNLIYEQRIWQQNQFLKVFTEYVACVTNNN